MREGRRRHHGMGCHRCPLSTPLSPNESVATSASPSPPAMEAWYVCACVSRTERSLPVPLVWDGGRAMEDELDRAEPDMSLAIVGRAMEEGSHFM